VVQGAWALHYREDGDRLKKAVAWPTVAGLLLLWSLGNGCGGAAESGHQAAVKSSLELASQEPSIAAMDATSQGDYRLIGITSAWDLWVPGVAWEDVEAHSAHHGVRWVQGAGDVITGKEELLLATLLPGYARRYNRVILQHLEAEAREEH
jgi:hypothetical protein